MVFFIFISFLYREKRESEEYMFVCVRKTEKRKKERKKNKNMM